MPLAPSLNVALHKFFVGKAPEELVFNLSAPSLGMIIKMYAKKAGLNDFHTHTLRDKFASDLLAAGVDIQTLRILMGHENLNTTQAYLALNPNSAIDAIAKLDNKIPKPEQNHLKQRKGGYFINKHGQKSILETNPESEERTAIKDITVSLLPANEGETAFTIDVGTPNNLFGALADGIGKHIKIGSSEEMDRDKESSEKPKK
jgi:hypothetical protein